MGRIFDTLKTYQISLGDFEREYEDKQRVEEKPTLPIKLDNEDSLAEKLGIHPAMLENLNKEERIIYTIGIYLLNSLNRFVFDSNAVHIRMTSNKKLVQGLEYKILSKVSNGLIKDDELAFRLISIIYQMVYRDAENIRINYTPLGLVVIISDPESKGVPILLKLTYKEDESQTLDKANKLQVSKTVGSDFSK